MDLRDLNALDPETRAALKAKVTESLWRRGNLRWKLDETQQLILKHLEGATTRKFLLLCSRRLGKSYALFLLAAEMCLKKPGARVLYVAPSGKDAADIATDIMAQVFSDCPEDLKPRYDAQNKVVHFGNNSIIRFKGVNGEKAETIRGGAADLVIGDEIGIWDDAQYVIRSVLLPMVLTTGGRILLATTPPKTPGHDSMAIYEELAQDGSVVTFTIRSNVRVSDEVKAEFMRECGERKEDCLDIVRGLKEPQTTTAKREYFCQFVTDASMAVLPEFAAMRHKIIGNGPPERPAFFDAYTVLDPGMKDKTGILYAHTDFMRGKVVIEDESLLTGASTLAIAEEIGQKEWKLWEGRSDVKRFSDIDLRLMADLWDRHNLMVGPVQKQDSMGAINLVRNMIQTEQLEIHPRCKHLIRQMENAIWNTQATDFARGGEGSIDGHYDLVAALKYLCRHANLRHNPFPEGWRHQKPDPNAFRSPRGSFGRAKNDLGLLADTPFGRRMAGKKRQR